MQQTATRLLSLLSLLQLSRSWSGTELAERLDVSTRTVRNDIGRLRELGYRVEGARGGEGGYRLGAGGSALPPLLLDDDEATAVAVGLRTGINCIIGGMEETSVRALAKLEQTLPSRLRQRVRNLNRYTVPLPSNHPMPIVDPNVLTLIVGLCDRRERLRFWYGDAGEPPGTAGGGSAAAYDVEPYRLVNSQHRWHLFGYDVAKDAWQTFEVDRIQPRLPSGPRFSARSVSDDVVATTLRQVGPEPVWRHSATVVVHAAAHDVERQVMPAEGVVEPVDTHSCTLRIGAESLETIALALGRLDVDFTIDDSAELRETVRTLADRYARSLRAPAASTPAGAR